MKNIDNKYNVKKIITLWAFSESVLGGFLHLFKIPFTGLIVGGLAIIFLSMLSLTDDYKKNILKGTITVLIIKFVISPYTPINAFFSVIAQGMFCYILSILIKSKQIRILIFSLSCMILFSLQKLIFLQILFGNSLWQAIDIYAKYIAKEVFFYNIKIDLSWYLILFYILVHFIAGIVFTLVTLSIINDLNYGKKIISMNIENDDNFNLKTPSNNNKKLKKVIKTFLVLLAIVLTYFIQPQAKFLDYLIVILRFFLIIVIWTVVISPFLTKITKKIILNKSKYYKQDVDNIISDFKKIKVLITTLSKELKEENFILRYFLIIKYAIVYYVLEN